MRRLVPIAALLVDGLAAARPDVVRTWSRLNWIVRGVILGTLLSPLLLRTVERMPATIWTPEPDARDAKEYVEHPERPHFYHSCPSPASSPGAPRLRGATWDWGGLDARNGGYWINAFEWESSLLERALSMRRVPAGCTETGRYEQVDESAVVNGVRWLRFDRMAESRWK
jgi:hypothetical protein